MTCMWNGSTQPRTLPRRHLDDCHAEECRGCQPCTQPHCRICYRTHAEGTCAECLARARETLHEIARLVDALPEEVEHRGIDGEAMALLAPSADPEARGHLEASVAAGRVPVDYLDNGSGAACGGSGHVDPELHPGFVLLSWQMVWRDALDHDEAPDAQLDTAVDYLDRTMTYMADFEHVPFEDFARDLRRCSGHLEAVLHDQNQGDRANVGCFECGADLERRLTATGFDDFWTCTRCRRRYTVAEYNFALRASIEEATRETA